MKDIMKTKSEILTYLWITVGVCLLWTLWLFHAYSDGPQVSTFRTFLDATPIVILIIAIAAIIRITPPGPTRSAAEIQPDIPDYPPLLQIFGVIGVIVGVTLGIWARKHSPHMGIGEMITKWDSYILEEWQYYTAMIAAVLLILGGVGAFLRSVFESVPIMEMMFSGKTESGLDKIKRAKELFDSGAIDAAEYKKIKKSAINQK